MDKQLKDQTLNTVATEVVIKEVTVGAMPTVSLHYQVIGEGPPLLILHGLFGSGSNWRTVARALAQTHTVYLVDLRNHGISPWADTMSYTEMAGDVSALIQSLALDAPIVLGHSMGGKVAMALALLYPQQVGHLIVVDIAPVQYPGSMNSIAKAMMLPEVIIGANRTEITRNLQKHLPDPAIAPFLMQNLLSAQEGFVWRINLVVIDQQMPQIIGFPSELKRLHYSGPSTAVVGEKSEYVLGADSALFAPMFKPIDMQIVLGAGHWVHTDKPVDFINCIVEIIKPK